jgi:membrane protein insertase Oxa1/YidC/SpoIIIJ
MVKMDTDVINNMVGVVKENVENVSPAYEQIYVTRYVKGLENRVSVSKDGKFDMKSYAEEANLNMDFLGIDLSQVPTRNLNDWKTLIIPVLYVISSFISIRLTSQKTKKKSVENKLITDGTEEKEEPYNPTEDVNKTMTWMMPIMSVSIAIIAPLGLALYWLMNNILMIIERLVFDKILKKEEEAENNA